MNWRQLLLIVMIVLFIPSVAGLGVTATTEPDTNENRFLNTLAEMASQQSDTNTCNESLEEPRINVVTPAGDVLNTSNNTLSLYPGTQVSIQLCGSTVSDEDWELRRNEGYSISQRGNAPVVTIRDGPVNLSRQIQNVSVSNRLRLQVPQAPVYEPDENQLFSQSIRFNGTGTYARFLQLESEFRERAGNISSLLDELDQNTSEFSATSNASEFRRYADAFNSLSENYTELQSVRVRLERLLHEQAVRSIQPVNAREMANRLASKQSSIDNRAVATTSEYVNKTEPLKRDLQSTVRTNILIGTVGGLVVGLILGALGPHRKGKDVDFYRQVSSRNRLTADVLTVPGILGLLLLIGGVIAIFVFGIFEVIEGFGLLLAGGILVILLMLLGVWEVIA